MKTATSSLHPNLQQWLQIPPFLIFPGPDYDTEKRDFSRIGVIW